MIHPIDSTLVHRVLLPEKRQGSVYPTIVFLHGRGADEEDLLGLSGSLDERFMSVAVRAPFQFEYGGFTWYEILDSSGKPEQSQFKAAYDKLTQFLDEARKHYPIDPNQLYLFGFSMGAVMSYSLALANPEQYAGVVAHSGYLAEETPLEYLWNSVAGKDFFVAHGCFDYTVPVEAARRARLLLEQSHARVLYKEYNMAHQISDQSLADVAGWLSDHITRRNHAR